MRRITCILTFILLGITPAWSLTTSWIDPAGGLWSDPTNWSNGVPGAADTAQITLNGTYTVTTNTVISALRLILGGSSGTQTLLTTDPFYLGYASQACYIGAHGVLDVHDSLQIRGSFTILANWGTMYLRNGGILCLCSGQTMAINEAGALLRLYQGSVIYGSAELRNDGNMEVVDSARVGEIWRINNSATGTLLVNGYLFSPDIENFGLVELGPSGTVDLNALTEDVMTNNGTVRMRGGSHIRSDGWTSFTNQALLEVVADTSLADDQAEIDAFYDSSPVAEPGRIRIESGNLRLSRASSIYDSVHVAAGCTLYVWDPYFDVQAQVTGSGAVHFLFANQQGIGNPVRGRWWFNGSILLTGQLNFPTIIQFLPTQPPLVHLRTLAVNTPYSTFYAPTDSIITVDSLVQNGGTLVGTVHVAQSCTWTEGTIVDDTSQAIVIPPGTNLEITGPGEKYLDSLDLYIEGSATMDGSGIFSLLDSATIEVAPSGTLMVGPEFTLTGVGTFLNTGSTTIDPQNLAVTFLVPVNNRLAARTPGTIDIPSGPVILGGGGKNESNINVQTNGEVVVTERYENEGTINVETDGTITVEDSLTNGGDGTVNLAGGSDVSGDGIVDNEGDINGEGSSLLTPTNIPFQPLLLNRTEFSRLDVLGDTLTLLAGGVNRGTIAISVGAVLKVYGTFLNDSTGVITGGGVLDVTDALFTNNGIINAGSSPGILAIRGNVTNGPRAWINAEISGNAPGLQYDRILVDGAFHCGGTLNLVLTNGFIPAVSDTFDLIAFDACTTEFAAVEGTVIGNGQFLEISEVPEGIASYVCQGVSDLSCNVASVNDTIVQTVTPRDTIDLSLCNVGHCPLQYTITVSNLSPPFPPWITLPAGSGNGLVTRTHCKDHSLYVNTSGFATGLFTAQIHIASNDPGNPVVTIPVSYTVVHGPEIWDLGGGDMDFATFTAAAAYLNSNVIQYPQVFNVYPGTYNESITINQVAGASATNTITFRRAIPFTAPVLTSTTRVLRLLGADYVTFDGLNFSSTAISGPVIQDTLGATNNVFRNLSITGPMVSSSRLVGIKISGHTTTLLNSGNLIDNVSLSGVYTGIGLGGQPYESAYPASAFNNEVRNCTIHSGGAGIFVRRQGNLRIHNNTLEPGDAPWIINTDGTYGLMVVSVNATDTVRIYDNAIRQVTTGYDGWGIYLAMYSGYALVYNNMLSDFTDVGESAYGIYIMESRCGVYFNSIRMTPTTATASAAFCMSGTTSVVNLKNNILAVDAGPNSACSILRAQGALTSNRNCFNGSGSSYYVGQGGASAYQTLAQWQAGMGQDAQSVFGEPGFAANSNLHVDGYYSLCDSAGTPVPGITADFDGEPRNATYPDMGADEFNGLYVPIDSLVIRRIGTTANVRLDWEPVPNAVSYKIYTSSSPVFEMTASTFLGESGTNSFIHIGSLVSPAPVRFYVVRPSTLPVSP